MPFEHDKFFGPAKNNAIGNVILEVRQMGFATKRAVRGIKSGDDDELEKAMSELSEIDQRLDALFSEITGWTLG